MVMGGWVGERETQREREREKGAPLGNITERKQENDTPNPA